MPSSCQSVQNSKERLTLKATGTTSWNHSQKTALPSFPVWVITECLHVMNDLLRRWALPQEEAAGYRVQRELTSFSVVSRAHKESNPMPPFSILEATTAYPHDSTKQLTFRWHSRNHVYLLLFIIQWFWQIPLTTHAQDSQIQGRWLTAHIRQKCTSRRTRVYTSYLFPLFKVNVLTFICCVRKANFPP